ncbi:MAG TPA: hypothetical protein VFW40_09765 [Capsulimonadaceae bacterium]|nr:hypothetical protein [Capsulimonadaceae bacterium]
MKEDRSERSAEPPEGKTAGGAVEERKKEMAGEKGGAASHGAGFQKGSPRERIAARDLLTFLGSQTRDR